MWLSGVEEIQQPTTQTNPSVNNSKNNTGGEKVNQEKQIVPEYERQLYEGLTKEQEKKLRCSITVIEKLVGLK